MQKWQEVLSQQSRKQSRKRRHIGRVNWNELHFMLTAVITLLMRKGNLVASALLYQCLTCLPCVVVVIVVKKLVVFERLQHCEDKAFQNGVNAYLL